LTTQVTRQSRAFAWEAHVGFVELEIRGKAEDVEADRRRRSGVRNANNNTVRRLLPNYRGVLKILPSNIDNS